MRFCSPPNDPRRRPLAQSAGSIHRPVQKKGAAPAGGESGGRVTGPALGGEAGSVLSESLSALGVRIDYEARIQRQPMELQHMPHTYEQVYPAMSMLLGNFFHYVR
jgi:hypothetical protein